MCSILLNKDKYKVPINHTTKNIKAYTKFLVCRFVKHVRQFKDKINGVNRLLRNR